MYKVMLADDEGIVIDSLKFIIEKNFKEQCIVEFAKTGRSVIELAEHFRPDIAFMDIQMPGINGIDSMKEIIKTNPNIIFIVLSAYDKFDYAKEAINLGVLEYLNKPVNQKIIVEVLSRAIGLVNEKREKRSNDLLIKEKLETVIPIIENGFIYSIMTSEHFTEDIENYKNMLGINQEYGYILTLVFGETQKGNYMTNAVGSSIRTQMNYTKVRELVKEEFDCVIGSVMSNKVSVFIPCNNKIMEYNERIELIEKSRGLVRKLKHNMGISFRIGIGSIKALNESMESYNESLKSLINTTGTVAHVDDLPIRSNYEVGYPIDIEKAILNSIREGNASECIRVTNLFFGWMTENYPDGDMNVKLKILELVLFADHEVFLSGGMTYHFTDRADYLSTIININDNKELQSWLISKLTEVCHNVVVKKEENTNGIIKRAQEYILQYYKKDISLDGISRELDISPYYFSKLFKDVTGINFVEYLTNVRIEKAKELLINSEMSMKEICVQVGYNDPNYFSRIFKKSTGKTPTEFKEGMGK
ncbi:two-component system response regulator YesN [Mobilisporobacter senegalensis]|uniref:Stage 0 sporulation protein A homolog n=1 Tax=Mobilisporobacter senegalensis TaxID=1329262 RepID=A0A3N1XVY9_9FIRM|nr:helix-turn-helix domain-containing protein [Mobilisporobacter senegalensis]ROR30371.1 two-component system response regulator YesN [Mobilisporobacter senegalensis]